MKMSRSIAQRPTSASTVRQREIVSQGGRAAQERRVAPRFTHETGERAGQLGGRKVAQDREHMARIGRRGAQRRAGKLGTERDEQEQ